MTEKIDLKPCPFCGSADAPKVAHVTEIEGEDTESSPDNFAVCCYADSEGCGATGGYERTPKKAAERWNRRASL